MPETATAERYCLRCRRLVPVWETHYVPSPRRVHTGCMGEVAAEAPVPDSVPRLARDWWNDTCRKMWRLDFADLETRERLLTELDERIGAALREARAAAADQLDAALAVKDPQEAVERCWELVKEWRDV